MKTTETPPPNPSPASKPPQFPRKPLSQRAREILFGVVLLVVLVAGYFAWSQWFSNDAKEGELITAVATRGDLEDTVTATGTLQPKEFVDVGTQVSGQLKKVHVEVGDIVKQGDLLAEIDPTQYLAKVDADRAQLRNQQAQLADRLAQQELADAQYKRQQNLKREEATSLEALQSAEATADSARAQVAAIRAQMQQTESTLRGDEASLGYTKINAPMAGTVVSQAAKQGQTLNANQSAPIVLRIADLTTMTVQAQVSEADVSRLKVGMEVYFTTLGGDNRRYRSTLRQVPPTPTVVNNVVLYDALFDVPNPDQKLMTQMTAQVFFVIASARNAVLVPITALTPVAREPRGEGKAGTPKTDTAPPGTDSTADTKSAATNKAADRAGGARTNARRGGAGSRIPVAGGRATVRVVKSNGDIENREVEVGVTTRIMAQILSGLEAGETVVVGMRAPDAAPAKTPTKSALTPNTGRGGRP